MMADSNCFRLIIWAVAVAIPGLGAMSCGEPENSEPEFPQMAFDQSDSERLVVADGDDPETASERQILPGETDGQGYEDRRALLAILKGNISNDDIRPYSADLVRSVASDLSRDVDPDTETPKTWITRASVVDADGNRLWQDRVGSVFQLVEFLKLALDQNDQFDFSVQAIRAFAEANYPELLKFPVKVPLGIEGAEEYLLEVPDQNGEYYEVARLEIDALVEQAQPPRYDGEVQTLEQTGPPEDRVDVVVLGDGYTAEEKSEFLGDARAVADRFQGVEPFDKHSDMMNFHAVWTPSEESGAGYDCTDGTDEECHRFRETQYDYTFMVSALADQLDLDFPAASSRVAMPLKVPKMFEVAAMANYDEVLLLSNSERRSGFAWMSGGSLTAFDDREAFPDVAVHEFGHSFGALGDEYYIRTDPCLDNRPTVPLPPNIGVVEDETIKWNQWMTDETPVPTPIDQRARYDIGAYRRAYNCTHLYRPAFNCKMRSSSQDFCAVCREQLVRRMYNDTDLLKTGYPQITRVHDRQLRFEAGTRTAGDRTIVRWRLDGERIGDSPELTLRSGELEDGWHQLELEVRENSTFIRREDPQLTERYQWSVRRK